MHCGKLDIMDAMRVKIKTFVCVAVNKSVVLTIINTWQRYYLKSAAHQPLMFILAEQCAVKIWQNIPVKTTWTKIVE